MPDSPLKVGLGVSLDEGVDGTNTTLVGGGVIGGGLMVGGGRRCVSGSVSLYSWGWSLRTGQDKALD